MTNCVKIPAHFVFSKKFGGKARAFRVILEILHRRGHTRPADIARYLGVTRQTISNYFKRFEEFGAPVGVWPTKGTYELYRPHEKYVPKWSRPDMRSGNRNGGWFHRIPVAAAATLSPKALTTYMFLMHKSLKFWVAKEPDGIPVASYTAIADGMGMDNRSARDGVQELVDKGMLVWTPRYCRPAKFKLLDPINPKNRVDVHSDKMKAMLGPQDKSAFIKMEAELKESCVGGNDPENSVKNIHTSRGKAGQKQTPPIFATAAPPNPPKYRGGDGLRRTKKETRRRLLPYISEERTHKRLRPLRLSLHLPDGSCIDGVLESGSAVFDGYPFLLVPTTKTTKTEDHNHGPYRDLPGSEGASVEKIMDLIYPGGSMEPTGSGKTREEESTEIGSKCEEPVVKISQIEISGKEGENDNDHTASGKTTAPFGRSGHVCPSGGSGQSQHLSGIAPVCQNQGHSCVKGPVIPAPSGHRDSWPILSGDEIEEDTGSEEENHDTCPVVKRVVAPLPRSLDQDHLRQALTDDGLASHLVMDVVLRRQDVPSDFKLRMERGGGTWTSLVSALPTLGKKLAENMLTLLKIVEGRRKSHKSLGVRAEDWRILTVALDLVYELRNNDYVTIDLLIKHLGKQRTIDTTFRVVYDIGRYAAWKETARKIFDPVVNNNDGSPMRDRIKRAVSDLMLEAKSAAESWKKPGQIEQEAIEEVSRRLIEDFTAAATQRFMYQYNTPQRLGMHLRRTTKSTCKSTKEDVHMEDEISEALDRHKKRKDLREKRKANRANRAAKAAGNKARKKDDRLGSRYKNPKKISKTERLFNPWSADLWAYHCQRLNKVAMPKDPEAHRFAAVNLRNRLRGYFPDHTKTDYETAILLYLINLHWSRIMKHNWKVMISPKTIDEHIDAISAHLDDQVFKHWGLRVAILFGVKVRPFFMEKHIEHENSKRKQK